MSETKFTPGPWIVKRDDFEISVICKDSISGLPFAETPICIIEQEEDTGGIEDAHLIAAAPEMYKALERMEPIIEVLAMFSPDHESSGSIAAAVKSAIAKARGEQ